MFSPAEREPTALFHNLEDPRDWLLLLCVSSQLFPYPEVLTISTSCHRPASQAATEKYEF